MGVRKRDFQLTAIPFHYFVENTLIIHQRNHVSSNCLSSPSNTKFTEHLLWNEHFSVCFRQHCWNRKPTQTLGEDKAVKDQRRVAVEHQEPTPWRAGASQQKKKKKESVPLNSQMEACLPLGIFVGRVSFCCGETDTKHIQMCTNTHDVFLILITTCSWFIID